MVRIGYFLSSEDNGPRAQCVQARMAEQAGFDGLWISDHFHPWIDEQGQSPLVWSVIGALSQICSLPVTTAVTCPTIRTHPAIIAQAAATSAVLHEGRFVLGVGTGEALNEHVVGAPWPAIDVRLGMLEEAVEVMRALFTGEQVTHRGRFYTVETARLYTLPEQPPPIYMSAFGPKAVAMAARIADGYISTSPDAELLQRWRDGGGGTKPAQAGVKVCWSRDAAKARATAYRLWPTTGLSGELSQVLPTPAHFEQATELVTEEHVASSITCGDDVKAHVDAIQEYVDAGFDEVYVSQIGPEQEGFFAFYAEHVLPEFR
jgi:G6PDH family F420-dependent oxidoreductase